MSRQATSFVLGYHGCDLSVAKRIVLGNETLQHSQNDYDWLGHGIYFWESDPKRAWEWAINNRSKNPGVLGAVIDLGN